MGNITAIEFACVFLVSRPDLDSSGTKIIPPPAPNRPLTSPAKNPPIALIHLLNTKSSRRLFNLVFP